MQSWICNALSFSRFSPFLLPDFTVLPLIGAVDACFLADRSKSKLYRFDKDGNQWKERGAGTVKFLKHKASGKVRLLMRQSKMLKIYANQLSMCFFFSSWVLHLFLFQKFDFEIFLFVFLLLIVAVLPTMSVQEHAGNEKSCVWHARDFADGELKDELFCIRFPSIESELCLFFWS